MSERKAVILLMAAMGVVTVVVCSGLALLRVSDELIGAAVILIGITAAYLSSRIVMHYASSSDG